MTLAQTLIGAVQIWGIAGGIVALVFLSAGIDRIDEDARGAYVFRPLLIPAILLIWPLVLWRWWVLETGRDRWRKRYAPPRQAHPGVAITLALAVIIAIGIGLSLRQVWPEDFVPQRLSPPATAAGDAAGGADQ